MDKISEIERLLKTASRKTEEAANQYKNENGEMVAAATEEAATATTTKTRVAKPALATAVDMDVEESDDLASAVRKKKSTKKKGTKK
jgi:hypothetical protein